MRLNIRGRLREWDEPVVMGILNVTPDSFHAASRVSQEEIADRAAAMLSQGAAMLDIGGFSTRPGAPDISSNEELDRLLPAIESLRGSFPEAVISADTFRTDVARQCVEAGADIINDIGGGDLDPDMFDTVATLRVPYILMHMRGTPATMQSLTDYDDVAAEVLEDLALKADRLHQLGVCDVILDPGFGFAKTVDQNYALLGQMGALRATGCPVLAGVSRKTMVWRELGVSPDRALNGTTALHMLCLIQGADILRVHDVREAVEAVGIYRAYKRNLPAEKHLISWL